MEQRSFGDGVCVSVLGIGCGRVGSISNPVPMREIEGTLEAAVAAGVNLFGHGQHLRRAGRDRGDVARHRSPRGDRGPRNKGRAEMPSIWITSKSRPERSDAIQSFMRAADSATNRREAADFDRPALAGPGTSPSGNRTDRANLRVATLISISWTTSRASPPQLPPANSVQAALPVKAAKPWPLDFDLAAVEADPALRFPPAVRPPVTTSRMPWTTDACASRSIISPRASMPEASARSGP